MKKATISKSTIERIMNHCITQFGHAAIENDNLFCNDCEFWYDQLLELSAYYRTLVPACTMENCKYYSLFAICTNHRAKMQGMYSLSTTPRFNPHCKANRAIKGSICEKCFSVATLNAQKNQDRLYCLNTRTLMYRELTSADMPIINAMWFRLEAFGDLGTVIQAKNYMLLANCNPHCTFAWWTKNPVYIGLAINDGIEKPANTIVIFSSLFRNQVTKVPFDFIDKVFTVYDTEDIAPINCGKRSCVSCRRCYTHNATNEIEYVNELLK